MECLCCNDCFLSGQLLIIENINQYKNQYKKKKKSIHFIHKNVPEVVKNPPLLAFNL